MNKMREVDAIYKGKRKGGILIIVLVVLIACIVVLSFIIIFLFINDSDSNDNVIDLGYTEINCDNVDFVNNFIEGSMCIQSAVSRDGGVQEINEMIDKYNSAIEEAKKDGNYNAASFLITDRSSAVYLHEEDGCELALRLLDEEDFDYFPEDNLGAIYSRAISAAMECKDEARVKKWEDLLNEVRR